MHTLTAFGVLFALVLLSSTAFAQCLLGEEVQLVGTDTGANNKNPSIYGNTVVYDTSNNGNYPDINQFSLSDLNERQVTNNSTVQSAPAVYGDTVVWQDSRAPTTDIYRYDLATQAEYALATQSVYEYDPRTDSNKVVWRTGGGAQIYTCNLVLNNSLGGCMQNDPKTLVHDKNLNSWPDVYGNKIVWADGNLTLKYAVYLCDTTLNGSNGGCLAGNKKTVLTDYDATRIVTRIHGNNIVWQQKPSSASSSYYDIYRYDLSAETAYPVSTAPHVQEYPDVHGNIIVWDSNELGNFDIYMCDITLDDSPGGCGENATKTQVTSSPQNETKPAIYEDKIVYEYETASGKKAIRMMPLACGGLSNRTIWENVINNLTTSMSWGDEDGDGGIDLAVGNYANMESGENYTYHNQSGSISLIEDWTDGVREDTWALAWGDMDRDGYLEFAVGNDGPDKIYDGTATGLTTNLIFNTGTTDNTTSIAFGDVDNDGDLDLGAGNCGQQSVVYENVDGNMTTNTLWVSGTTNCVSSIAFGDVDSDGDLDLAVGYIDGPNYVYENVDGTLTTNTIWTDGKNDHTFAIAFADVDNDGDLDLAVGNYDEFISQGEPNYVYENVDGTLTTNTIWTDGKNDHTKSIAFADVDNDGDLDLAVGNNDGPNYIYENANGNLTTSTIWTDFSETFDTESISFGDPNNDGDLELAVGNWWYFNRIYENVSADVGNANAAPASPTSGFSGSYSCREQKVNLAWGETSDDKTPALSLYYNIRVGTAPGMHDIVSGVYGQSGTNAYFGNGMLANFRNLNLPNGNYYWAVQAIDGSLKASDWSAGQVSLADAAPNISGILGVGVNESSGFNNNVVDLWAYASDDSTVDENLAYAITSQSNPAVVDCNIDDSNRYVDCTTVPDMNGYSDIGVGITDECGQTDFTTFTVNVVPNMPPVVQITMPADGASFSDEDLVDFAGTAADPEEGMLAGAALVWNSNIDGVLGTGDSNSSVLSAGTHVITLTATDSKGKQGTASITLSVCATPADGLVVNRDVNVCSGSYNVVDTEGNGAIVIDSDNITLDCDGAQISGDNTGRGIVVNGYIPAEWFIDGNPEGYLDANKIAGNEAAFEASVTYRQGITIRNCNVSGYDFGLAVTGGDEITVENVTAHGNVLVGMGLQGLKNSGIRSNAVYGNGKGGLIVLLGKNNVTELNEVYSNAGTGIIMSTGSANITRNNNVHDNESGISIGGADEEVRDNTVLNNTTENSNGIGSTGIIAVFSSGAQITGNNVQNSMFGLRFLSSNDMNVADNNVENCATGISVGAWLFAPGELNSGTFVNNRVLNSSKAGMHMTDAVFFGGNTYEIRNLVLQGNYFKNPGVWDLHVDDRGTSYLNLLGAKVRIGAGASIHDNSISGNSFMGGGVQAEANKNSFCVEGVGNTYGEEAQSAPEECA